MNNEIPVACRESGHRPNACGVHNQLRVESLEQSVLESMHDEAGRDAREGSQVEILIII